MDGRRSEMRRTMTLSEQLATPDLAIRDFLNVPQDDADAGPHEGGGGMINWKPLRDRLRLRRAANAWRTPSAPKASGAVATPATATNINRSNKYNNSPGEAAAAFSRAPSLRFALQLHTGRPQPLSLQVETPRRRLQTPHRGSRGRSRREEEDEGEEQDKEEAPAAQMSLMALLEQKNSWDDDEDEESGGGAQKNGGGTAGDDDDCEGQEEEEEMVHVCCVCMVRHKGAAFIPCGHTFCRLCSRELWVSRGNCPLCNGFIQEVLDIF